MRTILLLVVGWLCLGVTGAAQYVTLAWPLGSLIAQYGPIDVVDTIDTDAQPETNEWLIWGVHQQAYKIIAERPTEPGEIPPNPRGICESDWFHPLGLEAPLPRGQFPIVLRHGQSHLMIREPMTLRLLVLATPPCPG